METGNLSMASISRRATSHNHSVKDALTSVVQVLCLQGAWDCASAFLIQEEQQLVNEAVWPADDRGLAEFHDITRRSSFGPDAGLPGRVWASGKAHWVENIAEDKNLPRAPFAVRAGLMSALAFPVVADERVIGVVEAFSRHSMPPDQTLLDSTELLGLQLGQFILRKRAEAELARTEQLQQQLIDSSLDAIISIDSFGIVKTWSLQAANLFGWEASEARGRRLSQLLIPERYREAHERGLKRYLRTGEGKLIGSRVEIEAKRKDETEFPVELTISPTRWGEETWFTAFVRDISERRLQERRREDFLAFASHELRTPLTSVIGSSKLLASLAHQGKLATSDVQEIIDLLAAESERMGKIVELFLDLTQIQSGDIKLEQSNVDMLAVIKDEVDLARMRHPTREIDLITSQPSLILWTDEQRLRQIVVNLIQNALKYGDESREIVVTAGEQNGKAIFGVKDFGRGIPPEDQPFLFERFYRGGQAADSRVKGLGLGLFLVKQLTSRLGGDVGFVSGPGGTEFKLWLPLG